MIQKLEALSFHNQNCVDYDIFSVIKVHLIWKFSIWLPKEKYKQVFFPLFLFSVKTQRKVKQMARFNYLSWTWQRIAALVLSQKSRNYNHCLEIGRSNQVGIGFEIGSSQSELCCWVFWSEFLIVKFHWLTDRQISVKIR